MPTVLVTAYCYADLALSSLVVAVTIAGTYFYLLTEGWPGWVDLGDWLHAEMVYPPADSDPSMY